MKKFVFAALVLALVCPLFAGAGEVSSKYDVNIYGYVKLDAIYQDAYIFPGIDFALSVPPSRYTGFVAPNFMGPSGDQQTNRERDSFGMTARQSRLGFLITTPATDSGIVTRGRLEMDFYGYEAARVAAKNQDPIENSGEFRLRRATIEIMGDNWSILAGNEWMIISPLIPMMTGNYPYGADIGSLGYRTPQIRLTGYALDKKISLAVAVENKMGDYDTFDIDTGRAFGSPAYEAGLTYADKGFLLALTGHYGQEEVKVVRGGGAAGYYGDRVDSYSYNASLKVPLGDMLTLSGEWFMGANLDGWYTGAQENGWLGDAQGGDREALKSTGWWVNIGIKPVDTLTLNCGYGVDDPDDDQLDDVDTFVEPNYYGMPAIMAITKNQMYFANLSYNVSPSTMITLEWMQIITSYDNASNKNLGDLLTAYPGNAWATGLPGKDWGNGVADRYTVSFWYLF